MEYDSPFHTQTHFDAVMSILRGLGTTRVTVEFSGSGDSGSIDDARLEGISKDVDLSQIKLDWAIQKAVYWPQKSSWENITETRNMGLDEILKQICNDALDRVGIDWYNNEGGQGELTIDFGSSPPKVTLNVGQNVTTTDDYEFNISPANIVGGAV